jgi:hypothetical protein
VKPRIKSVAWASTGEFEQSPAFVRAMLDEAATLS